MNKLIKEILINKKARNTAMLATLIAVTLVPGEPWVS
jgi:hypothetical protein